MNAASSDRRQWLVNVSSPFPRERRDRNYGPFATKADAEEFAASLSHSWCPEVRPIHPAEAVEAP